ncbi:hypothetical protein [Staphylococcus phage vB_StaM_SA1]|nr:hypothetical protein [Staphylococcus phage vB_StaM_SA1]
MIHKWLSKRKENQMKLKQVYLIQTKIKEEDISAVVNYDKEDIIIEYLIFDDLNGFLTPSHKDEESIINKIRAICALYGLLDNEYILKRSLI